MATSTLGALLVLSGIVGLFWLDRQDDRVSKWTFVPLGWLLICMSRPLSSWGTSINTTQYAERAEVYTEGSPIDRNILTVLIVLAMVVLWKRRHATLAILRSNIPILLFLGYCLISVTWSDFPIVSFKRWMRSLGDVLMILVVLTDRYPESAIQWVLTRVGYVLVPMSMLFIRFFPEWGRAYSVGGRPMWTGVATDKNGLGALCMVVGAVVLWRWFNAWAARDRPRRAGELTALTAVLAVIVYLLAIVDSKTAQMCFLFGTVVVVFRRLFLRPWVFFLYSVVTVAACYLVLIQGVAGEALETIGREATLTGRTGIWERVLRFVVSPWFGAGFESYWMGERLWLLQRWGGNQAHNGYLEVYVNLGYMGLIFLGLVIAAGYRNIIASFRVNPELGRLRVAFFIICLTYNFSEATFKMMAPVWLMFLWATFATPAARLQPVPVKSSFKPPVAHTFVPRTRVKAG